MERDKKEEFKKYLEFVGRFEKFIEEENPGVQQYGTFLYSRFVNLMVGHVGMSKADLMKIVEDGYDLYIENQGKMG